MSTNVQESKGRSEAAVIGIVLAGVLSSIVIPGPYDWGSTLIGLTLLLVLFGYGERPNDWREALGMASAAAFCILLTFGRLLDEPVGWLFDERRGLSGWQSDEMRLDDYKPGPNGGWEALALWAIFVGLLWGGWWIWAKSRPPRNRPR